MEEDIIKSHPNSERYSCFFEALHIYNKKPTLNDNISDFESLNYCKLTYPSKDPLKCVNLLGSQ